MENQEFSYRVPILEKGLSIMEYLSLHPEGATLQDVKHDLELSQTTAYRVLNMFVRREYLIYSDDTKRYTLSCKLLTLGFRALKEHRLIDIVLPRLRTLRDRVRETACFGVLGPQKGVFIEQAQGSHAFSFTLTPGKPFDLHCSAPGKAIMAALPVTVRNQYLDRMDFVRYNERTITDRQTYLKELEQVAREGYALDSEEELTGVICVGAPVFDYTGYPCGAIWISGPKDRLPADVVKADASIIKETAASISGELGYSRT